MTVTTLATCIDRWRFGEPTSPVVKLHPGNVHWNGFSPLWVRECVSIIVSTSRVRKGISILNSLLSVNVFPQSLHLYGLSPRWLRSCRSRVACRAKALPQTEHLKFLSAEDKLLAGRKHRVLEEMLYSCYASRNDPEVLTSGRTAHQGDDSLPSSSSTRFLWRHQPCSYDLQPNGLAERPSP